MEDLGLVFTVVGATGDLSTQYLMPAFFFFQLMRDRAATRLCALALFVLGTAVSLIALRSVYVGSAL